MYLLQAPGKDGGQLTCSQATLLCASSPRVCTKLLMFSAHPHVRMAVEAQLSSRVSHALDCKMHQQATGAVLLAQRGWHRDEPCGPLQLVLRLGLA